MNINNLYDGQVIKNYKELCEVLEIKTTTGCSKKSQLNELITYCKYIKEGNKFMIQEVYKNPMITINDLSKRSKYIKPLANIIVEYLYNNPSDLKEVPISKLFVMLGITNNNYNSANYYRKELSQLYDIRLASIYYFYSNTRIEFKNIIERCLNNLKNRRVMNWYKVIMIKEDDKKLYKADRETEKFIIDTEKQALEFLQCKNMYELIKDKSKLKEFNKIVFNETGIDYFYAYDLVIGEKALKIEYNSIQDEKIKLNKLILNRATNIFNKDKYKSFLDDYEKLNDILIDISNGDDKLLSDLETKHKENRKQKHEEIRELDYEYKDKVELINKKYLDIYK